MTTEVRPTYEQLQAQIDALSQELADAHAQQTATGDVLRIIAGNPSDLQAVLGSIADQVVRLCNAGGVAEVLYPRTDGRFDRIAAYAYPADFTVPEAERPPRFQTGTAERLMPEFMGPAAMLERRTLQVADAQAPEVEALYPGNARNSRLYGVHTIAAVPLLRRREAVGDIYAVRQEVRPFTAQELALLETFADQAVIAIENARLFQELEERNRELTEALEQQTATSDILRVIASTPTDLPTVLNTIAESATRLCGAADALVFRVAADQASLAAHFGPIDPVVSDPFSLAGTLTARAIEERRTLHVPDLALAVDEYPASAMWYERLGVRTVVAAPLLRDDLVLGSMLIRRTDVRPFTDQQVALLKTFADQAVIAIDNARLFTELQESNRTLKEALEQQTATAEVLRAIASSPADLQRVLDTIAQTAAGLCDADDAVIYRQDGEDLLNAAHAGTIVSDVGRRVVIATLPRGAAAALDAFLDGRVVHIGDVLGPDGDRYPASRRRAREQGARTVLAAPLLREGRAIGVVNLRRRDPHPFSDAQIDLLRLFADQAVIAIENARLFQELQDRTRDLARSVDELKSLAEVTQAVSATLNLEEVLGRIVAHAQRLSGSDGGVVFEYDEAADEFNLRSAEQLDDALAATLRAVPLRLGQGAVGRAAATRAPVQIPDILAEGAYQSHLLDILVRAGYRALLAVPLLREERVLGGLVLNRKTPGEFAPEVVALMQTFASQSALAIQNARLFREIEEKSRQVEEASRHKSQFLANMSHELRTPLNAILGYTELIVDGIYGEVPEKLLEVLERVQQSGQHLLGLINAVLDLSKIEAGQLVLSLQDYSLQEVAHTVLTAVESLAAEKGLTLRAEIAPDLPPGRGDERRLNQVLLNLLGNAIKFTEQGTITLSARCERDGGEERFLVSVADTGPGIAAGDRERIFEEFQQADGSDTRKKGGTGLGLSIAKRIVELHGGRIRVESAVSEGSTFTFAVPVCAPATSVRDGGGEGGG